MKPIRKLHHIALVVLLLLGQILTPAMAKQLMIPADNHSATGITSASTALATRAHHHQNKQEMMAKVMEKAEKSCHQTNSSAASVTNEQPHANHNNDNCCNDDCQCPMGSCSSAGATVVNLSKASVTPSHLFSIDRFSPLQRYLPPLLKPPII